MTSELLWLLDATPEDRLGLSTYAVEALHITVQAFRSASTSTPTHDAQGANRVAIDLLGQVHFCLSTTRSTSGAAAINRSSGRAGQRPATVRGALDRRGR